MNEVRIGVFVCHCGTNIGNYVDVPEVVEYVETLPDVVYAESNRYSCSSDGLQKLQEAIKNHDLNRVVVASCSPRTHEPLFQSACMEVGLNKYLFEMANIRDQCSWVHMHEPLKATAKAKDLVRMAVAKARLLTPEEEPEIEIQPVALVIGGGVSGMTTALSLEDQGFTVHLVEKTGKLGGSLNDLDSLFPSNIRGEEVLTPLLDRLADSKNIYVYLDSEVQTVNGFLGNFDVEIRRQGEDVPINVGTIILATGAEYFEPKGLYRFELENVITQRELEHLIAEDKLKEFKKIVMIQCVGARNEERPYCSRICCSEAMKNAKLLADEDSDRDIVVLYRDLQTYGLDYTEMEWSAKKRGVKLVKYEQECPPIVERDDSGLHVSLYTQLLGEELTLNPDLVVLSVPLIPNPDNKKLSQLLKVPLNSDGFFMEAHVKLRPVDFATDGVYVCGTAHSPKMVAESIAQAKGAASRAGIPMAKGFVKTAAYTSVIDEDSCSGCGTCVELCPYKAITKNEKGLAEVIAAVCKGCGVCGASCPEKAITMKHFTNEEIDAQGVAALKEG